MIESIEIKRDFSTGKWSVKVTFYGGNTAGIGYQKSLQDVLDYLSLNYNYKEN